MFGVKINELRHHDKSAISIADYRGIIKYTNDAFSTLSGFNNEELLGKSFKIIRNKETPAFFYKQMWNSLNQHKVWEGIIKNKKKCGTEYTVRIKITPFVHIDNNEYFLAESLDMSSCVQEMEKYYQYNFDKLTGMHNRDIMIHDISHRENEEFQLALFDIDNFKSINDFYGYQSGDVLIKKVSEIILNHLDINDYKLYHISVDEFALVSFKANNQLENIEFKKLCKTIVKNIDKIDIKLENSEVSISLSVGLSQGSNIWQVLKEADMALSYAKSEHKHIVDFTKESNLNIILNDKMFWLNEMKHALNNNKIVPWVQAIYDNKLGQIVKFEALMRLIDRNNNVVTPFYFLDISKNTKIYEKLSTMMIKETLSHFSKNFDHFNINISWEDVKSKSIPKIIKFFLDECDNLGSRMTIELVESEGIENFKLFEDFIKDMKEYGVKIALDDFGSGYSNFIYLDKIKADYIKIDGTLIQDMMINDKTLFLVQSIVGIAKKFGIKTVAEFVSDEKIFKKVKSLDIDYSQGYYIAEPRPIKW